MRFKGLGTFMGWVEEKDIVRLRLGGVLTGEGAVADKEWAGAEELTLSMGDARGGERNCDGQGET